MAGRSFAPALRARATGECRGLDKSGVDPSLCCRQRRILSEDGRLQYVGGRIPLPAPLAARATRLSDEAVRAVAGLQGYVGVDVVLGPARDGSLDAVIEINPRLTTSYVGLRVLTQGNLAEVMLRLVTGQDIPPVTLATGDGAPPRRRLDRIPGLPLRG